MDDEQVFVAVVTDTQWQEFCGEFGLTEFAVDSSLDGNKDRVEQRGRIIPAVQKLFSTFPKSGLMDKLEVCGLPHAGIGRPADLFDDPHLSATGFFGAERILNQNSTVIGSSSVGIAGS